MAFRSAPNDEVAACFALGWFWRVGGCFYDWHGHSVDIDIEQQHEGSDLNSFDTHCSIFVILMVSEAMQHRVVTCARTVTLLSCRRERWMYQQYHYNEQRICPHFNNA